MKKFFALLAVVLAVVSCQKDVDNLDVNVGSDVATISVTLPEDAITRAVGGTDSSLGGLANTAGETIRVILKIYDEDGNPSAQRQVNYLTEGQLTTNFDVRLIPDREYTFVAWADKVNGEADVDNFYNTTDLKNVTLIANTWEAMNEGRDAFTATHTESNFTSVSNITLELKRPLAKLRVVTTDMEALRYWGTEPTTATVSYTTPHYTGFNAYEGKAIDRSNDNVEHQNYTIHTYTNEHNQNVKTLFTDYFFAAEGQETIQFNIAVADQNGRSIREVAFNTEIPVKRNNLTTIQGNILTDGDKINVVIMPEFDNGSNWNPEDDNKDIKAISSNAEFAAAMTGGSGKYIVVSDNIVISASAQTLAATRGGNGKVISIDLNGKTIIVENNDTNNALFTLTADDTLIFSGEGEIKGTGTGKLVNGGTVVVTGEAEVKKDAVADNVVVGVDALKHVCANGGEFTFAENLTSSEILTITANNVVINGNGKTLTSSAGRAINVSGATDVTIKNLTINASGERAINVIQNSQKVTIENVTATAANYTVNVAESAPGAVVAIKNSTLNGLCTVNVASAGANVTVDGSTVNCNDNNTTAGESYAALCLNKAAVGAKIIATNSTINVTEGSDSTKGRNGAEDGEVTINGGVEGVEVTKAVITYPGSDYYYGFQTIQAAVEFAEMGDKISLIRNVELTEPLIIANDKSLTLDLNGKTVEGTDTITGSFGLITNKGNLTVKNGTITLKAENNRGWNAYSSVISNSVGGNLTVNEDVTIEHLGGTDMAYGIDNLTNGKGTSAIVTINGATVKSTYRPIRQFLNGTEAANELYVKANSTIYSTRGNKAIWMQDPSKNANTGKLVVEAGAQVHSVYLDVTPGSTEWPVEVSVVASSLTDDSENHGIYTDGIPAGYEVVENDGIWTVVAYTKVSTVEELTAALNAKEKVWFMNDIKNASANMSNAYGATGINVLYGQTIDGNGKDFSVNAWAKWDSAINTTGGTIKNLNVTGGMRGIFVNHNSTYSEKVILENVTIDGTVYTISCDQGTNKGLEATNSTFKGWTSYAATIGDVKFTNCNFGKGQGYALCRPYAPTEFVGCAFEAGFELEAIATVTFENCTIGGVALTAENLATLVTYNIANASVK